jgi:hypothetical protein
MAADDTTEDAQTPAAAAIAAVEHTLRQLTPPVDGRSRASPGTVSSMDILAAHAELRVVQDSSRPGSRC